jgi:hypothetical protein
MFAEFLAIGAGVGAAVGTVKRMDGSAAFRASLQRCSSDPTSFVGHCR